MNISFFSFSFDPVTITDFTTRSVSAVLVRLVARGCEGTKVEVLENPPAELLTGSMEGTIESLPSVRIYINEADVNRLQGAKVIAAKGKWFLQSPNIQSRCGCGSSFSFEDKVVAFLSAAQSLAESSPLCQTLESPLENHQDDWQAVNWVASIQKNISELSAPIILQSGTYVVSNLYAHEHYVVAPWATVSLYELICATDAEEELYITVTVESGGVLLRRSIVIGVPDRTLLYRATSRSVGNNSSIDHEILVYGLSNSQVRVDAIGQVPFGLSWVNLRVHESQIFLWEEVKFRGIPSLAIASHDVVASHSLTTRGIDPLAIAYTTSRGLSSELATKMLITSQITALAQSLPSELVAHVVSYLLAFTHPKHRD